MARRPFCRARSEDLGGRSFASSSHDRCAARQIRGLFLLWRTLSVCRVETRLDAWGQFGSAAADTPPPLSWRLPLRNSALVTPVLNVNPARPLSPDPSRETNTLVCPSRRQAARIAARFDRGNPHATDFGPRSRGFPGLLLGQPFYGWSPTHTGRSFWRSACSQRPSGVWGGAKNRPCQRPIPLLPTTPTIR